MAKLDKHERQQFAAMVRGRMVDIDDVRAAVLPLICEVTRLREALDDIAMGDPRRTAFRALEQKLDTRSLMEWLDEPVR